MWISWASMIGHCQFSTWPCSLIPNTTCPYFAAMWLLGQKSVLLWQFLTAALCRASRQGMSRLCLLQLWHQLPHSAACLSGATSSHGMSSSLRLSLVRTCWHGLQQPSFSSLSTWLGLRHTQCRQHQAISNSPSSRRSKPTAQRTYRISALLQCSFVSMALIGRARTCVPCSHFRRSLWGSSGFQEQGGYHGWLIVSQIHAMPVILAMSACMGSSC